MQPGRVFERLERGRQGGRVETEFGPPAARANELMRVRFNPGVDSQQDGNLEPARTLRETAQLLAVVDDDARYAPLGGRVELLGGFAAAVKSDSLRREGGSLGGGQFAERADVYMK